MTPTCYRCDKSPCECADGITLYHGDALDVLPGLEPGSVRLLWTDPPYGHANQQGDLQAARVRDGVTGARKSQVQPIINDTPEAMWEAVDTALEYSARLLTVDSNCCCCCCSGGGGPNVTFARTAIRMDRPPWTFFHAVVWDKSDRGHGMGWRFRRNYEFVMVSYLKRARLAWADDSRAVPNILRIKPPHKRSHPNEKPVELPSRFIEWTTKPGETVLDPFAGSGTTGRACKDLGRRCIMVEIEERYCQIAADRLRQGTLFT